MANSIKVRPTIKIGHCGKLEKSTYSDRRNYFRTTNVPGSGYNNRSER